MDWTEPSIPSVAGIDTVAVPYKACMSNLHSGVIKYRKT